MKNLTKISLVLALSAILSNISVANTLALTEEQDLLLTANIQQNAENFDFFKSTLNVFQLAILEAPELSSREKHVALKSTLSLNQLALLESNIVLEKAMREDFKNSLTDEQKQDVREVVKASLSIDELAHLEANRVIKGAMKHDQGMHRHESHIQ